MLPAVNRLKKKEDFQRVIQRGRPFSFGNIFLKIVKNGLNKTRIGFLVGKKVAKDSTSRNKIKRYLRGLFLQNIKEIEPGFDMVVSCKASPKKDEKRKFDSGVLRVFLQKVNLLKSKKKDVS